MMYSNSYVGSCIRLKWAIRNFKRAILKELMIIIGDHMGRTHGSMNKKMFKDMIIESVKTNNHRLMDNLAYQLQERHMAEEIMQEKGYAGNVLEIARRLPHRKI